MSHWYEFLTHAHTVDSRLSEKRRITNKKNLKLTCELGFIKRHTHLLSVFYLNGTGRHIGAISIFSKF